MLGIVLNGVAWVSAWSRIGPLAHYSFFPLWLGFILIVDALTEARSGTSLWRRGPIPFILLFVVSAPFWWYFERVNERVGNWHYVTDHEYGTAAFIFWASLAFSTVIPAVLAVTELLCTFWPGVRPEQPEQFSESLPRGSFGGAGCSLPSGIGRLQPALPDEAASLHSATAASNSRPSSAFPRLAWPIAIAIVVFGVGMLALALLFPDWFFAFLWLSLVILLDPINSAAGEDSVIGRLRAGAWQGIVRLMLAGLICGFFWEMWNEWSLPKWYYTVPHVGFGKIFAMPILGYGGYLPFALEIFAVYHFVRLLTRRLRLFPADFVRI